MTDSEMIAELKQAVVEMTPGDIYRSDIEFWRQSDGTDHDLTAIVALVNNRTRLIELAEKGMASELPR